MRVQAACRQYHWRYSAFIPALCQANIQKNRNVLSELAANEPFAFKAVVDVAGHVQAMQGENNDDDNLEHGHQVAA